MHIDDSLYHAIIAAHYDRDPSASRRLALRFPAPAPRHGSVRTPLPGSDSPARLGIVNPLARDVTSLTSLAGAIVRSLPFLRVRSTAPRCAANCG